MDEQNNLTGEKHLIVCQCVLPQYKSIRPPVYHKFIVFSTLNDGEVIQHVEKCNNCDVTHVVTDICKSEIINDDSISSVTIDDLEQFIPTDIATVLKKHDVALHVWKEAKFAIETKCERRILLSSEKLGESNKTAKKFMIITREKKFTIEQHIITDSSQTVIE